MGLLYKVVETSTVTDEELERILNEWTARGWRFDSIQFVTREASKRPALAFVLFTGDRSASGTDRSASDTDRSA
jgi:hypothetical protein